MGDTSKDDSEELLDATDPLDDAIIDQRLEPNGLDEALHEGEEEADEAGVGALLPADHTEA